MSELETAIIDVWSMKEHVLLFLKRYSDIPDPLTEDEVANHLLGIAYTIDLKAANLYDLYKQIYKLDEYAPPEVIAHREKMFAKLIDERSVKNKKKKLSE
jgi:hypothetical protein